MNNGSKELKDSNKIISYNSTIYVNNWPGESQVMLLKVEIN